MTPSASAPPPIGPTIRVERPAEKTLARGRYEAKPWAIWAVALGGVLLIGLYLALRARRARRRAREQAAASIGLSGKKKY